MSYPRSDADAFSRRRPCPSSSRSRKVPANAGAPLPHGGDHELRRQIAEKLLDSAIEGNKMLTGLTEVARAALAEATKKSA